MSNVDIPDSLFALYNEFADDFITKNFGVNCKLVYPAIREECSNCVLDVFGQRSSNIYKAGGPIPFTDGLCPYCEGVGYKEIETTETLKLRVNWSKKQFIKIATLTTVPDGAVQIIGFLSDLPKIQRSSYIILNSDQNDNYTWAYILYSEPMPHGFKQNRYFVATLVKAPDK